MANTTMTRRTPAAAWLAALLSVPVCAYSGTETNVIVIISDDHRYDAIGALGNPVIDTPHIDRMVSSGFRFDHTYNMGANTGAVCAPSRSMFMTGRNVSTIWGGSNISGVASLPSTLRGAGYTTFGTGKWHLNFDSLIGGFNVGEEVVTLGCIGCSATSHHQNQAAKNRSFQAVLNRISGGAVVGGQTRPGVHVSERFADAVLGFMGGQPASSPYFAYVSFTAPHDPRTSPPAFNLLYRDAGGVSTVPLPPEFATQTPIDRSAFDGNIRDEVLLNTIGGHTPANVAEELADYYGMISHMDAEIGRVLDGALVAEGLDPAVNDLGDLNNTLIVFTSDHGLAIGSHGLMGKQNPFEHSIRAAPLTFAGGVNGHPVPHGSSDALVYLSDMMPTILDWVGVQIPASVDGASLTGIIQGTQSSVRSSVYNAYRDLSRTVRSGDWKLMYYPALNRVQLFHLRGDPYELNDLSGDVSRRPRMETLGAELRQLEAEVNGPGSGLVPLEFFGSSDIDWEPASDVVDVGDVPAGNVVVAYNGGTSVVTAGGVTFQPLSFGSQFTGALSGRSTGDAGYDELLNTFTFGGGTETSLSLPGLVPGREYRVRAWFTDLRSSSDGRTMTFSDLGRVAVNGDLTAPTPSSVDVVGNLPGVDPPGFLGQYATGLFTAGNASGTLRLVTNGFGNVHLNAIAVEEVAGGSGVFCSGAPAQGTPCPCGNDNAGGPGGCDWGDPAFPGGALLSGAGTSSVAADDLFLVVTETANSFGIVIAGTEVAAGGAGSPVFDGLLCVGGQVDRLTSPLMASNHSAVAPAPLASLDQGAVAGTTRHYQYWFRSVGPCGQGANFSNGLSVAWTP